MFSKSVRTLVVSQSINRSFLISIKAADKFLLVFFLVLFFVGHPKLGRLVTIYINFHLLPVNVERVYIYIYIYIYICIYIDIDIDIDR